jgi:hypothetical protein
MRKHKKYSEVITNDAKWKAYHNKSIRKIRADLEYMAPELLHLFPEPKIDMAAWPNIKKSKESDNMNKNMSIVRGAAKEARQYGSLAPPSHPTAEITSDEAVGESYEVQSSEKETINELLENCSFSRDAQILSIRHTDYRILCYFLGVESPKDVKKATFKEVATIGMLVMETLPAFMESKGYLNVGQLNFDNEGNLVPCGTHSWTLNGAETAFINKGFLYFENPETDEKLVFHAYYDEDSGTGLICSYHQSEQVAKDILAELNNYAKSHNCLKGTKIGDINMFNGTLKEIESLPSHTWENYYYDEEVKDLFELEVFGFLNNVGDYNEVGITKRGVMLYGRPGTGKTTIGHIVCNCAKDHTVIWITPDQIRNNQANSISILYKLADYVTPAIVILEDLDLFAEDREGVTDSLRLGSLMNILDGVNSIKNSVTIATTNRISLIEQALSNRPGRFDRKVKIDALNDELRCKMFRNRLKDFEMEDGVFDKIIKKSVKWSGAEAQELVNTINLYFIKHKITNKTLNDEIVEAVFDMMTNFGAISNSKSMSLAN